MEFVALDVETANPDLESICQVAVVTFRHGERAEAWSSLLDPEDYFDAVNVSIHGITEADVVNAPTFPEILPVLSPLIDDRVVVSHSWFDRVALTRAASKYGNSLPPCRWLDTVRVARRTWPKESVRDYGLACLAQHLGLDLQHHNAESDANAAGEILLRAIDITGIDLEGWFGRVKRPIDLSKQHRGKQKTTKVSREGNPNGLLYGEEVVFTGTLSVSRAKAADLASERGCHVAEAVTKSTTILVVGQQDLRVLAGHNKSSKHRKAEAMIAAGHSITVLGEEDFQRLLNTLS